MSLAATADDFPRSDLPFISIQGQTQARPCLSDIGRGAREVVRFAARRHGGTVSGHQDKLRSAILPTTFAAKLLPDHIQKRPSYRLAPDLKTRTLNRHYLVPLPKIAVISSPYSR